LTKNNQGSVDAETSVDPRGLPSAEDRCK
jgi:hypothetical protein